MSKCRHSLIAKRVGYPTNITKHEYRICVFCGKIMRTIF